MRLSRALLKAEPTLSTEGCKVEKRSSCHKLLVCSRPDGCEAFLHPAITDVPSPVIMGSMAAWSRATELAINSAQPHLGVATPALVPAGKDSEVSVLHSRGYTGRGTRIRLQYAMELKV